MSYRLHEIDPIGLAMDWLEACKQKQIEALADFMQRLPFLNVSATVPAIFLAGQR